MVLVELEVLAVDGLGAQFGGVDLLVVHRLLRTLPANGQERE